MLVEGVSLHQQICFKYLQDTRVLTDRSSIIPRVQGLWEQGPCLSASSMSVELQAHLAKRTGRQVGAVELIMSALPCSPFFKINNQSLLSLLQKLGLQITV